MIKSILSIVLCIIVNNSFAQLLAFPTAEGAGKFTTGGRGSTSTAPTVYEVTTLNDDATSATTAGTFRYACTKSGPANRIIVFRVSGTIHLYAALSLNRANTTIAGQTAPGEGICIADRPMSLGANNIIIRYLRFRLGDKNELVTTPSNCGLPVYPFSSNPSCIPTANSSGNDDACGDNGGGRTSVVLDHCSASWSNDEAFTIYKGNNVTVQWCFITEPLNYAYHVESGDVDYEQHAYGGIWGGANSTFHHNLLAHCKGRMPRFDGIRNIAAEFVDFRNNVIYNWGDYNTNGGEGGTYNVVNNYYKWGPSTPTSTTYGINRRNMIIQPSKQSSPAISYGKFYLTGNYCDNSSTITNDNWLGASMNGGSLVDTTSAQSTTAFGSTTTAINMESALQAYNSVLSSSGCTLPNRDTLDSRIVNNVLNRTGGLIDVQGGFAHGTPYTTSQTAWPSLAAGTAQLDTDHDGMPDAWEAARGLNPNSNTDLNGYISTSGYNNIENYINGDTIVAVGKINTCITAKQINSTNSGQWLYARDSTTSYFSSPNYNASVDSNQIVAAILDNNNFGTFNISYYTTNTLRNDAAAWPYANRNITITPSNSALITTPVTVRIYISKTEFDALKAADATITSIADISIAKSNDNSCITLLPTSYTAIRTTSTGLFGTYQNGYFLEFQTSSFSTFFLQSKSAPLLPIMLTTFDVTKENINTAKITWTTQQEFDSKNFEIQRSNNNTNWQTIATVAAKGNSNISTQYNYNDYALKSGTYFYRLKQNNINNTFTYSNTQKLFIDNKNNINIYPNPVKNYLQIRLANISMYNVVIYDVNGRKLMDTKINNNATINTSTLQQGYYLVKISNSNESFISKIFITH